MAPRFPRQEKRDAFPVFQVRLTEPLDKFSLFHFLQVGNEKRSEQEHPCHADCGRGSDGHAQIGQDGSQRHWISAIAERTGYEELLCRHHGQGSASPLIQLYRDGPERQGEPTYHDGTADDNRGCPRLDSVQAKPLVEGGADDEKQVGKDDEKEDACKQHGDHPPGKTMFSLCPLLKL